MIALKKERKQPVIFRFGLVCSLGLQKRDGDSKPRKARRHVVHHVPIAWGEEEISKFLSDQGWTEVSAVTKRCAAWAFFGLCPAQEATQDTWIFNFTDTSDQTCHKSMFTPRSNFRSKFPLRRLADHEPLPCLCRSRTKNN